MNRLRDEFLPGELVADPQKGSDRYRIIRICECGTVMQSGTVQSQDNIYTFQEFFCVNPECSSGIILGITTRTLVESWGPKEWRKNEAS